MPVFRGRAQRRLTGYWFAALRAGRRRSTRPSCPPPSPPTDGPPPVAAGPTATPTPRPGWPPPAPRVAAVARAAVGAGGEPAAARPAAPAVLVARRPTATSAGALRAGGAREWQIALLAAQLEQALARS